ncbi:GNAT family N-acetyltransferase [Janthinobacterium sp. 17J80-10]|uniref:GNAT family N-acetyltransferase n=1 Tax=Janthinobacterium sp. 17J80-10 TaxID=2497863 RepID=UPI0010056574|nr:GNAT family N-acetyltransferase [Janthinobacterium sp. 17J80-10]QAU34808.1 N-acetyltransferase [Janthinobacterium sp. 17J80-10]
MSNYRMGIVSSLDAIGEAAWNDLVARQTDANPFLSYAFLSALHDTGCASADTGWRPQYLCLWQGKALHAALPLYAKSHSYGEYVFDWAWADAYSRHGLPYYPKLLAAIPFTPVSGNRLLARDDAARQALVAALGELQKNAGLSSTHVLFPTETEAQLLQQAGFMLRSGVQFHWENRGYADFSDFLSTLERKKSKNIRAERRKVAEAGVTFRQVEGTEATAADWGFFYRCYANTYAEHHSTPYLNPAFFERIGKTMPQHILLVLAERDGAPIAASLVVHDRHALYGRYWGALEQVPCLHFETAYYQPLEFCIRRGIPAFEGGAQGEHKLARGFLPRQTWSAHWIAEPAFADAIRHFLRRESSGMGAYIDELNEHAPFKMLTAV